MGTRADFYIGKGKNAKWLGSIAYDGFPDDIPCEILESKSRKEYSQKVLEFIQSLDHGTLPVDGWPWPWEDSRTTDYTYAFNKGKVYASAYGHPWFDATKEQPKFEDMSNDPENKEVFPNMKNVQSVTCGKRSGLMFMGF